MTKRRNRSPKGTPRRPAETPAATERAKSRLGPVPIVAVGLFLVGAAVFFVTAFEDSTVETAASVTGQAAAKPAPYHDSAEAGRPFPVTLPPENFTNETLRTAYGIAREIPEVLVQLPCLCGCDGQSEDHGSLLDCFVDNHAAT